MYGHILVPVDLGNTDAALGAMSVAKHLADLMGANVVVLGVMIDTGQSELDADPDLRERLEGFIEKQRAGYDVRLDGILRTAPSIAEGIIQAVGETTADLVVMASHDPSQPGARRGSNAAEVLASTSCSVLAVR